MSELIRVDEVSKIANCSESKAYKIMRSLNEELEGKGFIVIKGRINKSYLLKRLGIEEVKNEINKVG